MPAVSLSPEKDAAPPADHPPAAAGWGIRDGRAFGALAAIGMIDSGTRTPFLTFLPFILIGKGLTTAGVDPYSLIAWEMRTATITDEAGKAFFTQNDVEVPDFWSQTAAQVVASKYFRGRVGTPERESSARQMVDRIVNVMTGWGRLAAAPGSRTRRNGITSRRRRTAPPSICTSTAST